MGMVIDEKDMENEGEGGSDGVGSQQTDVKVFTLHGQANETKSNAFLNNMTCLTC